MSCRKYRDDANFRFKLHEKLAEGRFHIRIRSCYLTDLVWMSRESSGVDMQVLIVAYCRQKTALTVLQLTFA